MENNNHKVKESVMKYHRSLAKDSDYGEQEADIGGRRRKKKNEQREQKDLGREERNLCIFFNESLYTSRRFNIALGLFILYNKINC